MPYSRTRARLDAADRIAGLRVPFVYAKTRWRQLAPTVRNSIFQNCVFQLSAVLEDYIYQAIGRWLENLKTAAAPSLHMPEIARTVTIARHLEEEFRRYQSHGDEMKIAQFLSESKETILLINSVDALPDLDYAKLLLKDRKFPSDRNMSVMFRRIGISNIGGIISKKTKSDFGLHLRSFMDVRNALAHENPPTITEVDVQRYFEQINSWISAIDRALYSHVIAKSGSIYW